MKGIDIRKFHLLFLKNNLHRLSDETLAKLVEEVEDEVNADIDKELKEG